MLKLLCVTAHPDDEAGAFGGTLLLYHERGVETSGHLHDRRNCGAQSRARHAPMTNSPLCAAPNLPPRASCSTSATAKCSTIPTAGSTVPASTRPRAISCYGYVDCVLTSCSPSASTADSPVTSITPWQECSPAWRSSGQAVQIVLPSRSSRALQPHRAQKLYYGTADFVLPDRQPIAPPTVTARIKIGEETLREKRTRPSSCTPRKSPLFKRVRKNLGQQLGTHEMYHLVATRDPREPKLETDLFEGVVED